MQTIEQPPAGPGATPSDVAQLHPSLDGAEPELQLLLDWSRDPDSRARIRTAAVGAVGIHLLFVAVLASMPSQFFDQSQYRERPRIVTKLFDPPTELTQKAPNKGKLSKELVVQSPLPPVPVPTPTAGAKTRKFTPPPTPQPPKQQAPAPSPVEPPKIEQAQNTPQVNLPQLPPQIQAQERPPAKLTLENPVTPPTPPSGNARIPVPGNSVQEAVRDLSHGGNTGVSGSQTFDLGTGSGIRMPPSPGRPHMDYELKSDPMGVDFKPYIMNVLAIVSRNWFAVYPDSAKLGTRGQVKLEFAIAKDGKITKVVFNWQSGTQALDHAAVAAISASNPLPMLPPEYKGERIVLAFTFSYNMGR